MADGSPIEWTDASWNPVRGCERVSEGCRNCYAEVLAARFSGKGFWGEGLAKWVTRPDGTREARWTGKIVPREEMLELPLRWKTPRRVFVNSMSDLFHERVPADFIARVLDVAYRCQQHTFQILTKRPSRMAEFLAGSSGQGLANAEFFRNVWFGFSAEDQATWNERAAAVDDLTAHGFNTWASCEPLLGEISIRPGQVRWAVLGGESGPHARPTVIGHIRHLLRAFQFDGVPVFVKQLGAHPVNREGVPHPIKDKKGADMAEWPTDLMVREMPR